MKKLIIFVAILYFVKSLSECNGYSEPPKDAEVCYNLGAGELDNTCCFFKAPTDEITRCWELPKDESLRVDYIKANYPAFQSYTYTCFGSFLKASLLLITSLILL